jgi:hypothetical protein
MGPEGAGGTGAAAAGVRRSAWRQEAEEGVNSRRAERAIVSIGMVRAGWEARGTRSALTACGAALPIELARP